MDFMDSRGLGVGGLWHPVPSCEDGLLPLKEDCRLQSCRLGGLDAWMPGGLDAGGLDPGAILEPQRLVGLLAGRNGLDWM